MGMGGYLLRREILNFSLMLRIAKRGWVKFLILFFYTVNLTWAQVNEDRPLRKIPPNPSLPLSSSRSSPPIQAVNSLITEEALEQPLTQRYIEQYSSPHGIATLNAILDRGSIYLPFIKEEAARHNMPPELVYLPVIESGFRITARSKSGAVGLWQFMLNSITPYNIKVTDTIDERRDFEKSTRAALRKLDENYRTLGSWELALAAYNSGLGAINRIVQRTGRRDYWELAKRGDLRQETVHFVPKLIAANYIISQPRKYGINVWHEKIELTAIPLERQISLDILAGETGIPKELLHSLNAELLYGISPADPGFRLKIPVSYLEKITSVLENDEINLIQYYYHVVQKGETFWGLSRKYGVDLETLAESNGLRLSDILHEGRTLRVPIIK
jgi:membrane-bound lytic murein transglycosylase D